MMRPIGALVTASITITNRFTYSANSNVFDIYVLLAVGLVGHLMMLLRFDVVPVLPGSMLEEHFRRTLLLSRDSFSVLVERPITAVALEIFWGPALVAALGLSASSGAGHLIRPGWATRRHGSVTSQTDQQCPHASHQGPGPSGSVASGTRLRSRTSIAIPVSAQSTARVRITRQIEALPVNSARPPQTPPT